MTDHIRSPSTDLPFSFADLCVEAQLGLEHQFRTSQVTNYLGSQCLAGLPPDPNMLLPTDMDTDFLDGM